MVIYFLRHQYGKTYNIVLESGQVVMGMDIGLRDMCVGEKRTVIIPPHFGYGEAGVGKFKLNSRQTAYTYVNCLTCQILVNKYIK